MFATQSDRHLASETTDAECILQYQERPWILSTGQTRRQSQLRLYEGEEKEKRRLLIDRNIPLGVPSSRAAASAWEFRWMCLKRGYTNQLFATWFDEMQSVLASTWFQCYVRTERLTAAPADCYVWLPSGHSVLGAGDHVQTGT